jgi:trehalose 6-phosphate phosphatase
MGDGETAYQGLRSEEQRRLSVTLAARPRALLTDVDGTISAIAPTPEAATLLPGVRETLVEACGVFDLVGAISGRSAFDARRMVDLPRMLYVGNHGMEWIEPNAAVNEPGALHVVPAAQRYATTITAALDAIEHTIVPRFPGMLVERKGVTGSIHYRLVDDPIAAENAVESALHRYGAHELRITHGKQIVELRPPLAIDKGTSIKELTATHRLKGAVYLGDDRTDIDAFRALRELGEDVTFHGFSVAILHAEAPPELADAADLALGSVEEVPAFLHWLVERARRGNPR